MLHCTIAPTAWRPKRRLPGARRCGKGSPPGEALPRPSEGRRTMSIMPDHWIRRMAAEHGMIEPFVESQRREGTISFGLSSYGYDARVADEFKVFTNVDNA